MPKIYEEIQRKPIDKLKQNIKNIQITKKKQKRRYRRTKKGEKTGNKWQKKLKKHISGITSNVYCLNTK